MESISVTAWAKGAGISRQRAHTLIKQGRIPTVDGKIDKAKADKAFHKIRADGNGSGNGNGGGSSKYGEAGYWEEKTRRERAEASIKEIQLKKLEGELVEVDEALSEFSKFVDAVRNQLLVLPSKIAAEVYAQKNVAGVEREIENALHEALNEFGNYNTESTQPGPDQPSSRTRRRTKKAKAAPKAKGKRVGK